MTPWEHASFKARGGALDIHRLYKWIKIHLFTPRLLPSSSFPSSSSSTQASIFPTATNFSAHVWIRLTGQVGGLLHNGERRQGAPGGGVPDYGRRAQAPCHGSSHSLQKKDTSVTFWAERKKICHTYDTSMTVIRLVGAARYLNLRTHSLTVFSLS